jgi:hypothetical protein
MALIIIEEGIRPLVESLNQLPFAETVYSCEGHFEREPDPKYLPTAYVTFGVNDVRNFQPLYESFLKISTGTQQGSIRLTYDCLLGRYTLSVWGGSGVRDPQSRRRIVSALVSQLSDTVRIHKISARARPAAAGGEYTYPCGNYIPPCELTIPVESPGCPFGDPPGNISRLSLHAR